MVKKKYHPIKLYHEAHVALVVLAAEATIERGENVSMTQLLNELIMAEVNKKEATSTK